MTKSFFIFLIILTSCGVKEKEFDKTTWNNREEMFYVNRESMVNDLMKNHLHKGMSYHELIGLIGKPENFVNLGKNKIGYEIFIDYGCDIDPVKVTNLIIKLSNDSTIIDCKLERWEH